MSSISIPYDIGRSSIIRLKNIMIHTSTDSVFGDGHDRDLVVEANETRTLDSNHQYHFTNVTLKQNARLTVTPWDSATHSGGTLLINVSNTLVIQHGILFSLYCSFDSSLSHFSARICSYHFSLIFHLFSFMCCLIVFSLSFLSLSPLLSSLSSSLLSLFFIFSFPSCLFPLLSFRFFFPLLSCLFFLPLLSCFFSFTSSLATVVLVCVIHLKVRQLMFRAVDIMVDHPNPKSILEQVF